MSRRARTVLPPPSAMLAVAAGGAAGSLARWSVARVLAQDGAISLATLAVNLVGSLALGLLVTLAVERWPAMRLVRPFLATGVIGGFTTFSTFSLEVWDRMRGGRPGEAAVYATVSLVGGLLATAAGVALARIVPVRREHREQR